jgi:hypothetical protein
MTSTEACFSSLNSKGAKLESYVIFVTYSPQSCFHAEVHPPPCTFSKAASFSLGYF